MPVEIPKRFKLRIFPGKPEQEDIEIEILDVTTTIAFPEPLQPAEVVAVTYMRGLYPPSVVFVPKPGITLEKVKEAIRIDIERTPALPEKFII